MRCKLPSDSTVSVTWLLSLSPLSFSLSLSLSLYLSFFLSLSLSLPLLSKLFVPNGALNQKRYSTTSFRNFAPSISLARSIYSLLSPLVSLLFSSSLLLFSLLSLIFAADRNTQPATHDNFWLRRSCLLALSPPLKAGQVKQLLSAITETYPNLRHSFSYRIKTQTNETEIKRKRLKI